MSKIYYECVHVCGGAIRMGDPRRHWAVEAYMPFWTKERGAEV